MVDEALRKPRRKPKASLHLLESPLPIPIETITGKACNDKRWYYYFGTLQSDHVSISRLGDLTFLYRLGFFGRGILSRSQPQFEKCKDVLTDQGRKSYMQHFLPWEPEERLPQQQFYIDIVKERLRQHAVWSQIQEGKYNQPARNNTEISDNVEVNSEDGRLIQCVDLHTEIDDMLVEEATSESDDPELYAAPTAKESKTSELEMNDTELTCTDARKASACITNTTDVVMEMSLDCKNDLDNDVLIEDGNSTNITLDKTNMDNPISDDKSGNKRPLFPPISPELVKKIKLEDSYKIYECLQLTFEEAFFLSYGLGCLSVANEQKHNLTISEMWNEFSKLQDNFIPMYIAYHHFRSKGWVVRFSKIYGLDFVLYQDGVAFHHASYCVTVQFVHEDNFCPNNQQLSWQQLGAMCRVNERAGKEVLFCYVIQPKGITKQDLMSPSCIKKFKVIEVVLRRWAPEKYREAKE